MELADTLRNFLENGEDWERKLTSIKGVTILKLPQTKSRPASLAIEINPLTEKGTPMKKKGVMIMGFRELKAFREIFSNEKVEALVTTMEDIIPAKKSGKAGQEEVLQI
jgi:hypothetical protein